MWTPLHLAALNGKQKCLKLLVELNPSGLDDKDRDGRDPLLLSARHGKPKCLEFLVRKMPNGLNVKDNYGNTSLILSSKAKSRKCLKILLEAGVDISSNPTILSVAAGSECFDIVMNHLKGKIDVGQTPIAETLLRNICESMEVLMKIPICSNIPPNIDSQIFRRRILFDHSLFARIGMIRVIN